MSSNSLENEDMDNIPLVRMEDVQPSRERTLDSLSSPKDHTEAYETYIIDDIVYESECIVNDDEDSNIGSMVSLQSENVFEEESSSQELIIPECLEEVETENDEEEIEIYVDNDNHNNFNEDYLEDPIDDGDICKEDEVEYLEMAIENDLNEKGQHFELETKKKPNKLVMLASAESSKVQTIEIEVPPNKRTKVDTLVATPPSESWPTLEILPGGVIKNTDKYGSENVLSSDKVPETVVNPGEMMYACAKCSQTFKYLFCLVRHVKWHEDQNKIMKNSKESDLCVSKNKYICLHSGKDNIVITNRNKRKTTKRLKS